MKLSYRYLFFLFLKIGATSWGGFMALIAVIQKQMSEKEGMINEKEIVYAISLASVLPGPMAVNVVAFIGYKLKGITGALVSIAGVLLPCFVLMLLLCKIYFLYGDAPSFSRFFPGILPAVAAVIANVSFSMAKKNIQDVYQFIISIFSLAAIFFIQWAYTTVFIIFFTGLAGFFLYKKNFKTSMQTQSFLSFSLDRKKLINYAAYVVLLLIIAGCFYKLSLSKNASLHLYGSLAFAFSGLSISQFGGGYVVIPSMQKLIVDNLHWLTQQQFTDAIAMGQVTPGPIYISAAFVGYKLTGIAGALVATIAMFLPAAMITIFCAKFISGIFKMPAVEAAFKGIGAAITGMIAATAVMLLYSAKTSFFPLHFLFIICFLLSYRYKVTPVVLIPLAGVAGLLFLK